MSATIILTNCRIQKGYQDAPQVAVKDSKRAERSDIKFKVSNKVWSPDGEDKWNNYSIHYSVKKGSALIGLLSEPGRRVNIIGELSMEETKDKLKYLFVRAQNVELVGDVEKSAPKAPKEESKAEDF